MSGVGGYTENYDSNKWYKVASRIDATWTYKSFNVKSIKDNNFAQLFYQSQSSDTGFRVLSCTIKVSGLTDGQGIEYISNGTRPTVIMRIENDGIYHLPSFDFGAKNAYYGFRFLKLQESCNITIEQLPLYPGALVFDGVDDYGTCNNFPILTKEKGYTVVALRQWLSFQDIGYPTLVVNSTDRLAAFSFEDFRSKTKSTWNWGRSVGLSDYKIPLLYTYQTSTSYNSKTIYAGATEEGSNILQVCRSGIYCANAAIWEIVILDHDATEEELTKIKDYFVKTYPWLFPDQAWTVTGKTNEDEDRATIANITGNETDRKAIQVRVIPKGDHIVVEIVYKANECKAKEDNGIYAGIDIGLNNLATIGFNNGKGLIINGRPLKSINQYYNKKKSELSSELERRNKSKNSKRLNRLTTKRNNKVKDYLHKASTMLVNQLISNNVCKVVIGKNDGWKKEINIGKRNNQNFVNIPHAVFIEMVCYKCKLNGIEVVLREESYTSKCSFIDNEPIKKHDSYAGRRVKRGLFRSENGTFINADLNGALNILRKEVGEFNYNPIEVCSSPKKLRIGLS